jgi:hypothetical protein
MGLGPESGKVASEYAEFVASQRDGPDPLAGIEPTRGRSNTATSDAGSRPQSRVRGQAPRSGVTEIPGSLELPSEAFKIFNTPVGKILLDSSVIPNTWPNTQTGIGHLVSLFTAVWPLLLKVDSRQPRIGHQSFLKAPGAWAGLSSLHHSSATIN